MATATLTAPRVPDADLPGEVAVVDLDDADGLSDNLDEAALDLDDLSVDEVESLAVVELEEDGASDEADTDETDDAEADDADGPDEAADGVAPVATVTAAVAGKTAGAAKPAAEGGEGDDETFVFGDDDDDLPAAQVAVAGATADPVKDYLKQIGKVPLLNADRKSSWPSASRRACSPRRSWPSPSG